MPARECQESRTLSHSAGTQAPRFPGPRGHALTCGVTVGRGDPATAPACPQQGDRGFTPFCGGGAAEVQITQSRRQLQRGPGHHPETHTLPGHLLC